jgi:hypothetical protein
VSLLIETTLGMGEIFIKLITRNATQIGEPTSVNNSVFVESMEGSEEFVGSRECLSTEFSEMWQCSGWHERSSCSTSFSLKDPFELFILEKLFGKIVQLIFQTTF